MTATKHFTERAERIARIKSTIGMGAPYLTRRIDKGHANGAELHTITTSGVIIVQNERTLKVVTVLVARPQQLKRLGITDSRLIEIARDNQRNGYNNF